MTSSQWACYPGRDPSGAQPCVDRTPDFHNIPSFSIACGIDLADRGFTTRLVGAILAAAARLALLSCTEAHAAVAHATTAAVCIDTTLLAGFHITVSARPAAEACACTIALAPAKIHRNSRTITSIFQLVAKFPEALEAVTHTFLYYGRSLLSCK